MEMSFILHLVFQSSSLIKLHFLKAGQNNKIVIVAAANNKSSFHHLLSFAKLRSLKLLLCDFIWAYKTGFNAHTKIEMNLDTTFWCIRLHNHIIKQN